MEQRPVLVAVEGPLASQQYTITPEGLRIGRDANNEIYLNEVGVSRHHARVLIHNGAIWVQDAGSRNGVFVNGDRVADHRQVKINDRVSLGGSVFQITMPVGQRPATMPPALPTAPPPAAPTIPNLPLGGGGVPMWLVVVGVLIGLMVVAVLAGIVLGTLSNATG